MVKSYLRYVYTDIFGIITSGNSNLSCVSQRNSSALLSSPLRLAYVPANDTVLCWNVRTSDQVSAWSDPLCTANVSQIIQSHVDRDIFAVGYQDGSIRLWDARTNVCILTLDGHMSAITSLCFDQSGVYLASGSLDTDIIIWDIVAESTAFKLIGHRAKIIGLKFLHPILPQSPFDISSSSLVPDCSRYLIALSADSILKIWDLSTQHSIESHVCFTNSESVSLDLSTSLFSLIIASADNELKYWIVDHELLAQATRQLDECLTGKILREKGSLHLSSSHKISSVHFHPTQPYLAVCDADKCIQVWRERTKAEIIKKLQRKQKHKSTIHQSDSISKPTLNQANVSDILVLHAKVNVLNRLKAFAWYTQADLSLSFGITTKANSIEVYNVATRQPVKPTVDLIPDKPDADTSQAKLELTVDIAGHRKDIRCMALSPNDKLLVTGSDGSIKLWNVDRRTCVKTIPCEYVLCVEFSPDGEHIIVGCKSGRLQVYHLATATLIFDDTVHNAAIWSLALHPDGHSFVTGSADKLVKFWNIITPNPTVTSSNHSSLPSYALTIKQTRTLQMSDEILCVTLSPDARLIAVSTLDNTIKIFLTSTLKLYLDLYGHKLPVLSLSISSDSQLLASSSADKSIRIWGLDFGDCHRALFGHTDSVMQVAFTQSPVSRDDAHLLFSVSKDRSLRTWDADNFQRVQTLTGHANEIWCMRLSRTGAYCITASHDRSLRVWSQGNDLVFREEEMERELEQAYEQRLTNQLNRQITSLDAVSSTTPFPDSATELNQQDGLIVPVSKQTPASLTAAEKFIEALQLAYTDLTNQKTKSKAPRNAIFRALNNISPQDYLLDVILRIPASQIPHVLLLLPFSHVAWLFTFIKEWLDKGLHVMQILKVFLLTLRFNSRPIMASQGLIDQLRDLRVAVRKAVADQKTILSFNISALELLTQRFLSADRTEISLPADMNTQKRSFINVA